MTMEAKHHRWKLFKWICDVDDDDEQLQSGHDDNDNLSVQKHLKAVTVTMFCWIVI